ncbi:manganese efflux pump, partial [candidate division KSB1 bacterium]
MNWYIIIILAIGLAMDAVAASIAIGAAGRVVFLDGVKVALSFGAFQFAMPVIGWSLGSTAVSLIGGYDHWIAFF